MQNYKNDSIKREDVENIFFFIYLFMLPCYNVL